MMLEPRLADWTAPRGDEAAISVSEFLHNINQVLTFEFSHLEIKGEVASFKINQGKWAFFDLKEGDYSINCFMPAWQLNAPLEDGMKIIIKATAKVTNWGKFSLTVKEIIPVGEGSIKKAFELLKKKLTSEGLFDPAKKRPLPKPLQKIGVISSTAAAGYADFIKILGDRWGGLEVKVCHTQVQGLPAVSQIISALQYLNEQNEVQIIAIIRGGGSADDLAVFNDGRLVRAIAASRIPVITGIGHEVDESLADLAADIVGSTPSNVAEILTSERNFGITEAKTELARARDAIYNRISTELSNLAHARQILEAVNPNKVLARGYAIVSGELQPGNDVKITTSNVIASAKINQVEERK